MIKYYLNQTYFFHLYQSLNQKKIPVLVQNVNQLIALYKMIQKTHIPVWFDKAEIILKNEKNQVLIEKSSKTLKQDVSWCFKIANQKEYVFVLSLLINFKWTQLLEKFNNSPRIAYKVKDISDNNIKRNSLTKYINILLESNNYQP